MRIGIQAWGSTGDVRPLLALAGGLARAGHEVRVVATPVENRDYAPLCRTLGVPYRQVPAEVRCDIPGLMQKFGRGRLGRAPNEAKALRLLLECILLPFIDDMYLAAEDLCRTSDVVIGHFAVHPLKVAAQKAGRSHVAVSYWPALVPTMCQPPGGMPSLGRLGNRLLWALVRKVVDRVLLPDVARLWMCEGLTPPRHVLTEAWQSDRLNLVAASTHLWPEPSDWRPRLRMTGFFDLPEDAEPWTMPPALREFLDAGPPPVLMSLGSSHMLNPESDMDLMTAAARLAGARAIIQTTSPRFPPDTCDGPLYFAGAIPHRRLFPHCAAVVLHGGAGTTHSVAKSGLPSVVVGFASEQIWWGRQLARQGAAAPPIARGKATPRNLAARVRMILDTPEMKRRAELLATRLRPEDGVAAAVRYIEEEFA
jgi:sterol 3beta-glucosyltransferase